MPPHVRVNWEFFAVLDGVVAPDLAGCDTVEPMASSIWLFPPNFVHGWKSPSRKACKVVVLHFSQVPNALEHAAKSTGFLNVKLGAADRRMLSEIGKELQKNYESPTALSEIIGDRALMDLSLLLLRGARNNSAVLQSGANLNKVLRAEKWLLTHLEEPFSVKKTAAAAGLSTSQLCRVFRKVRNKTPHQALMSIRIERAMRLMADSDAKLEGIAKDLGFSSDSNFCRAFKAHVGKSPTTWRQEIYIKYKKPGSRVATSHEQHGIRSRAF